MSARPLPPDQFRVDYSELCEAGFDQLTKTHPLVIDVLGYFDFALKRRPWEAGEPCPAFPDKDLRLMLTPRTSHYPSLRVLFEIAGRVVTVWHVAAAE
jgi:hypothetical protein